MRRVLIILILISLSLISALTKSVETQSDLLTLKLDFSDYSINHSDGFVSVTIPQATLSAEQGKPAIPVYETRIAVPPGGDISVSVSSSTTESISVNKTYMPVPHVDTSGKMPRFDYIIEADAYQRRASQLVETSPAETFRGYRTFRITVHPVDYDHENKKLDIHTKMELRISISGNKAYRGAIADNFDEAMKHIILNWEQARLWRQEQRKDSIHFANFSAFPYWCRFEIDIDGIFKITQQELSVFLPVGDIDPNELRIFSTGGGLIDSAFDSPGNEFKEIPLYVFGAADNNFDPDDYILFYGDARDGYDRIEYISDADFYNPYSKSTVYWVTFGSSAKAPKRVEQTQLTDLGVYRNTHPARYHYEHESFHPEDRGFDWYSDYYGSTTTSTSQHSYIFNATHLDDNQEQNLEIAIREEPQGPTVYHSHSIDVYVNDNHLIGDAFNEGVWNGDGLFVETDSSAFLTEGSNELLLIINRIASTGYYLDYFTVNYMQEIIKETGNQFFINVGISEANQNVSWSGQASSNSLKAWEVTGFDEVRLRQISQTGNNFSFVGNGNGQIILTSNEDYLNVKDLTSISPVTITNYPGNIECLIITPENMREGADEIKQIHENNLGVTSYVVELQDVFNQFNGGMPDPEAIRLMVKHLYQIQNSELKYLLLIGSGVSDWRNFTGSTNGKNQMMVYQKNTVSSDDYFAYFDGTSNPELGVGRLPALNTDQLDIMIEHIKNYVQNPTPGWWRNTVLIVADDQYNSGQNTQTSHTMYAEQNAQQLHASVYKEKVFSIEYDLNEFHRKPQVRDIIVDKINEGVLVFYYNGHGSFDTLGDEKYFTGGEVDELTNSERMTFFLAASCSVGLFDTWYINCLAEKYSTSQTVARLPLMPRPEALPVPPMFTFLELCWSNA
ncbi:MAG: hypothetical protein K8S56_08700 [Candidatus Cloacimonetes bacterium]|nr:hypothetical protein [Candidatus Cloacimonadota bacterium]